MSASVNDDLPILKVKFKPIEVGISSAALLAVLITTGIFAFQMIKKQEGKLLSFFVSAASSAGTIAGAVYVGYTLKSTIKYQREISASDRNNQENIASTQKLERTFAYITRWNESYKNHTLVIAILTKFRNENDRSQRYAHVNEELKNIDQKIALITVLSFFEEIAFAIRENIVEAEVLRDFFQDIISDYMMTFGKWIEERRISEEHQNLYIEFTTLYEQWKK